MNSVNYLTVETRQPGLVIGFLVPTVLDSLTINLITDDLYRIVEESDAQNIVLDFSGITFISSGLLGKLIAFQKNCDQQDRVVKICNLNDSLTRLIKMMRLDSIFDLQPTVETAVNAW